VVDGQSRADSFFSGFEMWFQKASGDDLRVVSDPKGAVDWMDFSTVKPCCHFRRNDNGKFSR
jgi:hypothetical protein